MGWCGMAKTEQLMRAHKTTFSILINNKKCKKMEQLIVGQTRTAKLVLTDDVTGAEIPTSWENVTAVSQANQVVTAVPDGDPNFVTLTGQGEGITDIIFTTTAAYNNSNGVLVRREKTFTLQVQVFVTAENPTSFKVVLL